MTQHAHYLAVLGIVLAETTPLEKLLRLPHRGVGQ